MRSCFNSQLYYHTFHYCVWDEEKSSHRRCLCGHTCEYLESSRTPVYPFHNSQDGLRKFGRLSASLHDKVGRASQCQKNGSWIMNYPCMRKSDFPQARTLTTWHEWREHRSYYSITSAWEDSGDNCVILREMFGIGAVMVST